MADELRDESSRGIVQQDAAIYACSHDPDVDSEAFAQWAMNNAAAA